MINWYLLFIPAVTSILNRLWRGEAGVPRAVWYAFMVAVATGTCFLAHPTMDMGSLRGLTVIWLVYFLGYALMPWQAMFSATHGNPPGRKDNWAVQWMQMVAKFLTIDRGQDWYDFGIVYGIIRATLMIPGILLLAHFYGSHIPLIGLVGLMMGFVYYAAGLFARHFNSQNMAVPFAEMAMGWWHGTYILIVAGCV